MNMIETQGNKGKKTSKYGGENKLNYEHEKSKMRLFCRLKFCEIGAFLYIFI